MAKIENKEYFSTVIDKLKMLRVEGSEDYRYLFAKTKQEFNLSDSSLYRYMKKDSIFRKKRNDSSVEKRKKTKIISAAIGAGKSKQEAEQIADEIMQAPYSDFDPAKFFERIFKTKLIPPEGLRLKLAGLEVFMPKSDVENVLLILKSVYNRFQFAQEHKLPNDPELIRHQMILYNLEEQLELVSKTKDIKHFAQLTAIYDRLKEQSLLSADIKTVEKIARHFKPDISFSEVASLIRLYAEE